MPKSYKRPKDHIARNHRWRHNSFFGHTAMMRRQLVAIIRAESTTKRTKELAAQMHSMACNLEGLLKERDDAILEDKNGC